MESLFTKTVAPAGLVEMDKADNVGLSKKFRIRSEDKRTKKALKNRANSDKNAMKRRPRPAFWAWDGPVSSRVRVEARPVSNSVMAANISSAL